jgi:hypothetical protein
MSKIILENNEDPAENSPPKPNAEATVKPNVFKGRTEAQNDASLFPDWDIVPPGQFINPRIKLQ